MILVYIGQAISIGLGFWAFFMVGRSSGIRIGIEQERQRRVIEKETP